MPSGGEEKYRVPNWENDARTDFGSQPSRAVIASRTLFIAGFCLIFVPRYKHLSKLFLEAH